MVDYELRGFIYQALLDADLLFPFCFEDFIQVNGFVPCKSKSIDVIINALNRWNIAAFCNCSASNFTPFPNGYIFNIINISA